MSAANILEVYDGDTFLLGLPEYPRLEILTRLGGIDTCELIPPGRKLPDKPEVRHQHLWALAAFNWVQAHLPKQCEVTWLGRGVYRRNLAILEWGDTCLQVELLKRGLANIALDRTGQLQPGWNKIPNFGEFIQAQQDAQSDRIGIWGDPYWVAPVYFRRTYGIG